MAKESKQESFEQLYAKLEDSVARLEAGGLSLDEAIALYEEGMMQAKRCQERLDEAEQRITRLKESFASLPRKDNGAQGGPDADYEYVSDADSPDEDDPFA